MVKVENIRVSKDGHAPLCHKCRKSTTPFGKCGSGTFYACRRCEPQLFAELERMGLIYEKSETKLVKILKRFL